MSIRWTAAARADVKGIRGHYGRQSPQYALSVIERIFARVEILADFPRIGSVVEEYQDDELRELFEHAGHSAT